MRRRRDKVSVIAALRVAPTPRQMDFYFLADPKHYITAETVVRFLRKLLRASATLQPLEALHEAFRSVEQLREDI